jgi:hypothetical protein
VRVLLDECLPRRLKRDLVGHDVRTAPEMGWASKTNGELLALAAAKFHVFLTSDRNLSHQLNVAKFDIAVLVLIAGSNRLEDLRPLVPRILEALVTVKAGTVTPRRRLIRGECECGYRREFRAETASVGRLTADASNRRSSVLIGILGGYRGSRSGASFQWLASRRSS